MQKITIVFLLFTSVLYATMAEDEISTIDLAEWNSKLIGKKIIPLGGVATSSNEYSEDDIKARVPSYRIINPGDMITMDYRSNRLNINVDVNRIAISVSIG
ncbi:hypothetical protein HA402_013451 [Bradysia odoriphaga]|nr:hypothetical protein HA402_013451 [Bradysia odoriphaga]